MSTSHTPGPWELIGKQGTAIWAGSEIIAQSSISRAAPRVAHANSLLMAAAPDLLEALERLVSVEQSDTVGIEWKKQLHDAVAKARAAIAKATGGRP